MWLTENIGSRLVTLAFRNVRRNRRRSLLTIAVILTSFVALNVFQGYIANSQDGWGEILIRNEYGHLQIFRDDYFQGDETSLDHMISGADAKVALELLKGDPRVAFASPRVALAGLIGNGNTSRIFVGSGREPREFDGMYLSNPAYLGEFLTDEVPNGVVVGKKLAEKLGVKLGEDVLLMSYSKMGSVEATNGKILGFSKTGNDQIDSMQVYLRLKQASEFLLTDDVHNIVVLLRDKSDSLAVRTDLARQFRARHLPLLLRDFGENAKFFLQIIGMYRNYFTISLAVLSLIIFTNISNSIYMSVTDREREFATMKVIGISRPVIFTMILLEGLLLAGLAVLVGTATSYGVHQLINGAALTLPPPPGGTDRIPFTVAFHLRDAAALGGTFVLVAGLSSIFPATHVVRSGILKGLKSV